MNPRPIGHYGSEDDRTEATIMVDGQSFGTRDGQLLDRYLARFDEAEEAFEALVAQHGPMVLAVCRRVLGDRHDAEDAFQATFLIFARRARTIRRRDSLACWLHGVARRVAMRAKADASRRRAREARAASEAAREVGAPDDELGAALHEEIGRLPERYREPIVLCDLEGLTHAEAARRLSWPVGTVSGRLSRAWQLLRDRIARRGLVASACGLAALLRPADAQAVPIALAEATTRSAVGMVAGGGVAAGMPAAILAREALRAMVVGKIHVAAAAFIAAGAIAAGAWRAAGAGPGEGPGLAAIPALTSPRQAPMSLRHRIIAIEAETTLRGQSDGVTSLDVAPDGRTVAAAEDDATVTLWDAHTGRERLTLTGHTHPVLALKFVRGGLALASASRGQLKLWDVATGREMVGLSWLPEPTPPRGPRPDEARAPSARSGTDQG
jgi:RNA polymerase sigma factor (sigma-70 family)